MAVSKPSFGHHVLRSCELEAYRISASHFANCLFTASFDCQLRAASLGQNLCPVGWTELVDQSFGVVGFLDDVLLVVLTDGTAQFVIVHGGAVLATSP